MDTIFDKNLFVKINLLWVYIGKNKLKQTLYMKKLFQWEIITWDHRTGKKIWVNVDPEQNFSRFIKIQVN